MMNAEANSVIFECKKTKNRRRKQLRRLQEITKAKYKNQNPCTTEWNYIAYDKLNRKLHTLRNMNQQHGILPIQTPWPKKKNKKAKRKVTLNILTISYITDLRHEVDDYLGEHKRDEKTGVVVILLFFFSLPKNFTNLLYCP